MDEPKQCRVATLTVGGNDIGFYNILTACVLRVGQLWAGDCGELIGYAKSIISDRDPQNDISSALHQMIDKSGRDDFKIYQTGYPAFFNVDTDSCDYTTFYYWQPGHHVFHHFGNWAYLYKALRLQLHELVAELNQMLSQVADSVNRSYPSQRVWFIDPNPRFDGHRFCEKDGDTEVIEPDQNRMDTWLFLSGRSDNPMPGSEAEQVADEELNTVMAGNVTALPDPKSCNAILGQSTDWTDRLLCETAMVVTGTTPDGDADVTSVTDVFGVPVNYTGPSNVTVLETQANYTGPSYAN